MSAVTSNVLATPDAPNPSLTDAPATGWAAQLSLGFSRRGAATRLTRNRFFGPLRVQKPFYPEGDEVCHAYVLHPPAGIVGGDRLSLSVELAAGAHALLTTPGAGKWYRSDGREASLTQRFVLAAGAVLEWLPQETLVFDGARARLSTQVSMAADAGLIHAELTCLGRTARGERFTQGAFEIGLRLEQAGRPRFIEQGLLAGNDRLLTSPVGLRGQPVFGTLLACGSGVDGALLDACRDILPTAGEGALTLLDGDLLVARWLGPACEPGQQWLRALWHRIRPAMPGRAGCAPRIWAT